MNKRLLAVAVVAGLALAGCNDHNRNSGPAQAPPGTGTTAPTDFTSLVNQSIGSQPAFGAASPVTLVSPVANTSLDSSTAFGSVNFGTGDALPTGTYQASAACTQAGPTVCNPSVSSDPNSTLN